MTDASARSEDRGRRTASVPDNTARLRWRMIASVACMVAALLGAAARAADNNGIAVTSFGMDPAFAMRMPYNSRFERPLWMESEIADGTVTGVVHAMLDFPFTQASAVLSEPASWCDILMLHFNVKSCVLHRLARQVVIDVGIGRKFEVAAGSVHHIRFLFNVEHPADNVLHVQLLASEGPLSTSNYLISVMVAPSADDTFAIRLAYAYDYGLVGKLAMQAYLSTLGRNKVGFSIDGVDGEGQPRYVAGMRGAVERNAMRYCLAIESFMRSLAMPPQQRLEARLEDWFASVERYPRQLHEMDRHAYLDMKRREIARQKAATAAVEGN